MSKNEVVISRLRNIVSLEKNEDSFYVTVRVGDKVFWATLQEFNKVLSEFNAIVKAKGITVMENKIIYNTTQFAKLLGVSKKTLYKYIESGLLPDRRNPVNNYRVFFEEDIESFKTKLEEVEV